MATIPDKRSYHELLTQFRRIRADLEAATKSRFPIGHRRVYLPTKHVVQVVTYVADNPDMVAVAILLSPGDKLGSVQAIDTSKLAPYPLAD